MIAVTVKGFSDIVFRIRCVSSKKEFGNVDFRPERSQCGACQEFLGQLDHVIKILSILLTEAVEYSKESAELPHSRSTL